MIQWRHLTDVHQNLVFEMEKELLEGAYDW